MSKYVDANDKILYMWVHLHIIAPVCHLEEHKLGIANLLTV